MEDKYAVSLLPSAYRDLEDIYEYIAEMLIETDRECYNLNFTGHNIEFSAKHQKVITLMSFFK